MGGWKGKWLGGLRTVFTAEFEPFRRSIGKKSARMSGIDRPLTNDTRNFILLFFLELGSMQEKYGRCQIIPKMF